MIVNSAYSTLWQVNVIKADHVTLDSDFHNCKLKELITTTISKWSNTLPTGAAGLGST